MNSLLGLRDRLTAAPASARTNLLVESILRTLGDELGVDERELHPRSRFENLGVDSKRALEFKELLEEELGCALRTTLLFDYPSPESLAAYVVSVAFGETEELPVRRRGRRRSEPGRGSVRATGVLRGAASKEVGEVRGLSRPAPRGAR